MTRDMAGLPMSRYGPKGSKMVPNGQYNMFLTIWDIFGLIWTLLDHFRQNLIFCSKLLWPRSTLCFWGEKLIFVLKGPKWCKWVQMVPNGQKHVILTIWDPFGPHRDIGKPSILPFLLCLFLEQYMIPWTVYDFFFVNLQNFAEHYIPLD